MNDYFIESRGCSPLLSLFYTYLFWLGSTPATITGSAATSGGVGSITYQWLSSTDQSTWTEIPGATSTAYSPGALTASTYYRRRARSGSETVYSNTVKIIARLPIARVPGVVEPGDVDTRTRGLKLYEQVAVLDGSAVSSSPNCVERTFYYDSKGRLIQTQETNHLGGVSVYSTKYGVILRTGHGEQFRQFDTVGQRQVGILRQDAVVFDSQQREFPLQCGSF